MRITALPLSGSRPRASGWICALLSSLKVRANSVTAKAFKLSLTLPESYFTEGLLCFRPALRSLHILSHFLLRKACEAHSIIILIFQMSKRGTERFSNLSSVTQQSWHLNPSRLASEPLLPNHYVILCLTPTYVTFCSHFIVTGHSLWQRLSIGKIVKSEEIQREMLLEQASPNPHQFSRVHDLGT